MRVFTLLLAVLFYGTSYAGEIKGKLIDVQSIYFMHFYNGEYKEIFRTPKDSHIYGYGLLSNNKAFFAYQDPGTAEAVAKLVVIDSNSGKTVFKDEFGGAGETSFHFTNQGVGVFNDFKGLNVIKLVNENVTITPIKEVKDENPYAPFWVAPDTIGYFIYHNEQSLFKTIKAP